MAQRLAKIALVCSAIALLLSIATFLKTGGIADIKQQVSIIRNDLNEAQQRSEQRMENRSVLFEALYDLSDSVDSLQAGNDEIAEQLITHGLQKIESVEENLEERKRAQLERLRRDIKERAASLERGDLEGIRQFEDQIRLLRIFEENL
jgi:hypothetical protein